MAWRKERSGCRNLILTISLRKNETQKRRNAETQKQTLVRDGFRMILDAQEDIEVVGEAADGLEAVAKACELGGVAFPPKCDSSALRHEQTELLLAAAGALRSPLPVVDFVRRSISTFYLVDVRAKG